MHCHVIWCLITCSRSLFPFSFLFNFAMPFRFQLIFRACNRRISCGRNYWALCRFLMKIQIAGMTRTMKIICMCSFFEKVFCQANITLTLFILSFWIIFQFFYFATLGWMKTCPFFKFYSFWFLSPGVDCQEPDSIRIPQNSLIHLRENRPISLGCAATQQ